MLGEREMTGVRPDGRGRMRGPILCIPFSKALLGVLSL